MCYVKGGELHLTSIHHMNETCIHQYIDGDILSIEFLLFRSLIKMKQYKKNSGKCPKLLYHLHGLSHIILTLTFWCMCYYLHSIDEQTNFRKIELGQCQMSRLEYTLVWLHTKLVFGYFYHRYINKEINWISNLCDLLA